MNPLPPLPAELVPLGRWLMREIAARTPDDDPRTSLFLRSPDKSIWEISVANDGTISATKVKSS